MCALHAPQFAGKRLLLAVDDVYRLSGITLKLLAFEQVGLISRSQTVTFLGLKL
jgi:hypothetical protein